MPCVPCNQRDGRTVMVTVPAGAGNAPTIKPPESAADACRAGADRPQADRAGAGPVLGLPRDRGAERPAAGR